MSFSLNKYVFYATIFLIGISQNIFSQTTYNRNLSFSYGQLYNLKLDYTFSRLSKSGFNNSFKLSFYKYNENTYLGIGLLGNLGGMTTRGTSYSPLSNYAGNLHVKYLKRIARGVDQLKLYVGGNAIVRGEIWFPDSPELRYGWDINTGLSASFVGQYKINNNLSVQYDFDIHLIGVLWRAHINGQQLTTEQIQYDSGLIATAFENAHLSHAFNTTYIDNSILLKWHLSEKVALVYNFIFTYVHITPPILKKGYEYNNHLGLNLKI